MGDSLNLQLHNSLAAIAPATEVAEAWLNRQSASLDAAFFVSLVIDEIVTNCVKYGYDDDKKHVIDVVLSVDNQLLTVLVIDDGHAFNPVTVPPPDLSLPIEDRPIGGLGIHLLRQLSDSLTYERREGTNRLTLTKRIERGDW
jgi:anti-sigma regulatory factor (Ser/Thr protein kinase)